MQDNQLELIIGENLASILTKDDAKLLGKNLKDLRKEKEYPIPLVHITDEIKTDKNSYEIRKHNKTILKHTPQDKKEDTLIKEIITNIDNICKT